MRLDHRKSVGPVSRACRNARQVCSPGSGPRARACAEGRWQALQIPHREGDDVACEVSCLRHRANERAGASFYVSLDYVKMLEHASARSIGRFDFDRMIDVALTNEQINLTLLRVSIEIKERFFSVVDGPFRNHWFSRPAP